MQTIYKKYQNTYVDADYNYLTDIKGGIKAKDKETQEGQYQTLLKDLDKLLIESFTVRAKFNASEEMRNQIPKDSAFLEGFEKLQSDYTLFEEKINQVCHQLHLIDEKFNQENNTNKENNDIYERKYALFISEIKKIIEEKKEKEEEPPPGEENSDHTKYENLLKDLDKVLIDSVSVRVKFNAIEEMKGTAPTNLAIF